MQCRNRNTYYIYTIDKINYNFYYDSNINRKLYQNIILEKKKVGYISVKSSIVTSLDDKMK